MADLAISKLAQLLLDIQAQSNDHVIDLLVIVQLCLVDLFHIQNFASERKDGLEFPISCLLGTSACRRDLA